jgi:hypothetical protein
MIETDRDRVFALCRGLRNIAERAKPLANGNDYEVQRAYLSRARNIAANLQGNYDSTLVRTRASDIRKAIAIADAYARQAGDDNLVDYCGFLLSLMGELDVTEHPSVYERRIGSWARWLTAAVARLLPKEERSRYAEEWRCELWDLADRPRRHQAAYALRVLVHAWPTRRAVRQGRRRTAVGG